VGSHVVRLLCERGERVRVLVRPTSRLNLLEGLPVEPVEGDLRDVESLRVLLRGASTAYHVAADYRLWASDPTEIYRSNVDGTANFMSAARLEAVPKLVYTSTVGCLGVPRDGSLGTEETPVKLEDMVGHYKRSKFLAEQGVMERARVGLPVVIVNPSTPIGSGDIRPTPTGRVIVDFLAGRIPAFVDTGLNIIDVRDVAAGHLLAAEKGRAGQKYVLGCRNVSLAEWLAMLAAICERPPPRICIPHCLAFAAAAVCTAWAGTVTRREPLISLESVRMSRKKMFFSPAKAVRELGLPQSAVETALKDAVRWFCKHGYVSLKVPPK